MKSLETGFSSQVWALNLPLARGDHLMIGV